MNVRILLQVATVAITLLGASGEAQAGQNVFSVASDHVLLNGAPFKIIGLRLSNGLVSDAKTQELIDHLDVFKASGVNTVSVFFMGSRFGDIKGYLPDSTLDPTYATRMAKVIEAADARGMVVLVGCLYWGTSTAMSALTGWQQAQANLAIANTVKWLSTNGYHNVFVDPDNEGMSPFTDSALIAAGHHVDPSIMIACNRGSASISGSANDCGASSDLNIHFGPQTAGKPWLQSEGVPDSANYWGAYSKTSNYDNYIRIGLYTAAMKALNISDATTAIDQHAGYMLASTWLQCGPGQGINGPFMTPGGSSSVADVNANVNAVNADAGVKWWLDAMKASYGAWAPGTANGGAAGGGNSAGAAGSADTAGAAGAVLGSGGATAYAGAPAFGGTAGAAGGGAPSAGQAPAAGGLGADGPSPHSQSTSSGNGCALSTGRDASARSLAAWSALCVAFALLRRRGRSAS